MSCSQYEHLIQGYIDQSITEEEKKELNDHVSVCDSCRKELQDMIEVVSFMEDIGEIHHQRVRQRLKKFKPSLLATCMTVCSAVVFVLYSPTESSYFNVEGPRIQYRNIVLADENEQLPFPDNYELFIDDQKKNRSTLQSVTSNLIEQQANKDSYDVTWVYPSIYSHLDELDFDQLSDEYVFINIPDEETLHRLIDFLERENLQIPIHVSHYPVSIVINRGEQDHFVKEFEFPTDVDQIHQLLDEINHHLH
ncbi:anti-sigma factor family protein [Tepidibacillus fermentans]|uniref:Anti-sigma-W factor RsiW n=1 Tax=Tepidibacillus fermentans TaxID=1281767 RepID=A0A4R3KJ20_9BACI|nr:zf-HC2 domain-containing protein [Tepidibacillus fermentans]TCS83222.1 putative zinc finger protein [Tepidibacillus fermentans]